MPVIHGRVVVRDPGGLCVQEKFGVDVWGIRGLGELGDGLEVWAWDVVVCEYLALSSVRGVAGHGVCM